MLPHAEYLAHFDADSHLLAAAAARGIDVPVPGCPGWSVTDLLDHVSRVYSSRIDILEQGLTDTWPPRRSRPKHIGPLAWFRSQAARLVTVLADADPEAPAMTFANDRTVGFWIRRMAHETLIHRIDGEQAHGYESEIDPGLALDGIAEMFDVFITRQHDEAEFVAEEIAVKVASVDRAWTARFGRLIDSTSGEGEEVPMVALDDAIVPAVTFSGEPQRMLLWMWGRAPLDHITVTGPVELAGRFRDVCSV
jgi:uncharacterized protein (TIGR03083 family)